MAVAVDTLPGYRRRFIVTAGDDWVRGAMEDDYHAMALTIRHDGTAAIAIEPDMARVPWTTCPGALAVVRQTFTAVPLTEFERRGAKSVNCTHLHDLAVLAAAHAGRDAPLVYDILVADPVDGATQAEIRRDDVPLLAWTLHGFRILAPAELAGITLDRLRPWLDAQPADRREAARLLRLGVMIASGRAIPMAFQSVAGNMPVGNCHTFQPSVSPHAVRVGAIRDFPGEGAQPLGREAAALAAGHAGNQAASAMIPLGSLPS